MTTPDYLRRQASELRALARDNPHDEIRRELEKLAEQCEKLANEMSGNGHDKRTEGPDSRE